MKLRSGFLMLGPGGGAHKSKGGVEIGGGGGSENFLPMIVELPDRLLTVPSYCYLTVQGPSALQKSVQ